MSEKRDSEHEPEEKNVELAILRRMARLLEVLVSLNLEATKGDPDAGRDRSDASHHGIYEFRNFYFDRHHAEHG